MIQGFSKNNEMARIFHTDFQCPKKSFILWAHTVSNCLKTCLTCMFCFYLWVIAWTLLNSQLSTIGTQAKY